MTKRPEDAPKPDQQGASPAVRRATFIIATVIIIGVGFAGVYGIGGGTRNAVVATGPASTSASVPGVTGVADDVDNACSVASETGRAITDLAKGELAAFAPTLKPTRIPDLAFLDPDGKPTTLHSTGGSGLKLVNIWATWCAPCRQEMPALDELQRELGGGEDFEVVTINIDTRDAEKPKLFMEETGIRDLALYTDPKAKTFQELRAVGRGFGLPTTMLIDGQGCEIGHIAGPAEWASPDAVALIRAALAAKGG